VAATTDGSGRFARSSLEAAVMSERSGNVLAGAFKGALAGAAGVWLMDLVSAALYQQEGDAAK
jgi:hypothetical protein